MSKSKKLKASKARPLKPVTLRRLFRKSCKMALKNWKLIILINIIPFLTSSLRTPYTYNIYKGKFELSILGSHPATGSLGMWVALVLAFFVIILVIISSLLNYYLTLQIAAGKKPGFQDIWQPYLNNGLRLLGLVVLQTLMVSGGLILFIVPGLWLFQRFLLAPFILVDRNTTIREALLASFLLTTKYSWPVWKVILGGVLVFAFSFIIIIGPFISTVLLFLFAIVPALRYVELRIIDTLPPRPAA